ncbi:PTS sugar transporter subunit IIA [bacterium]|jgi:mannitol/fructose-specific phosphotransferase system IIA component (Ntr-type)|nr:PTS sugar transporter subunit IIA [bacterium]
MRLSHLLSKETISVLLVNRDKQGVIEELLDLAVKTGMVKDREVALKAVLNRENLMSTGLERGVAVPHAKTRAVDDLAMALGISKEGTDFQASDGKPSHLFFFLLAPEDAAGPNVKVLAQIARLTSDPKFCKELREAVTAEDALNIIKDAE